MLMLRFLFFFVSIAGGYISADAQNIFAGIVGCYSFSGNALDNSGNGNHGSVYGAKFVADRYGVDGGALEFNGSSDYVSFSRGSFTNEAFTYSVWFKITEYPSAGEYFQIFFAGSANGIGQGLKIGPDEGLMFAFLESSGETHLDTCFYGMNIELLSTPNTWTHVAVRYEDCATTIYVNGNTLGYVEEKKIKNSAYGSTPLAFIGKRSDDTRYFKGMLDDVIIYDRALTHDELQQLFEDDIHCNPPPMPQMIRDTVTICGRGDATFYAGGGEAYRWYEYPTGGSAIHEGNTFTTPELLSTKEYFVSNVTNTGESKRARALAYVAPLPHLSCPEIKTHVHQQVMLDPSVTSGTPPYTYTFDTGDGHEAKGSDIPWSHVYTAPGNFKVIVTVSDANYCSSLCVRLIQVDDIFIPNVITVNEDTFNNHLTVYEKRGDEIVSFSGQESFQIKITNRWGAEIFASADVRNGWQGENADAGIYFYTIILGRRIYKGPVSLFK
jgi:hypothetical protein